MSLITIKFPAAWLRSFLMQLSELKALVADMNTKLDTFIAADQAKIADLEQQLAAALANAVDPAEVQAIADMINAATGKLTPPV